MDVCRTLKGDASRYVYEFQKKTYRFSIFAFEMSSTKRAQNRFHFPSKSVSFFFYLLMVTWLKLKRSMCGLDLWLPNPWNSQRLSCSWCNFGSTERFSTKKWIRYCFFWNRKNVNFWSDVKKISRYSEQNENMGHVEQYCLQLMQLCSIKKKHTVLRKKM